MTYRELLEKLSKLDNEQLDCDVSLYDYGEDEYYPITNLTYLTSNILDENHPILIKH